MLIWIGKTENKQIPVTVEKTKFLLWVFGFGFIVNTNQCKNGYDPKSLYFSLSLIGLLSSFSTPHWTKYCNESLVNDISSNNNQLQMFSWRCVWYVCLLDLTWLALTWKLNWANQHFLVSTLQYRQSLWWWNNDKQIDLEQLIDSMLFLWLLLKYICK